MYKRQPTFPVKFSNGQVRMYEVVGQEPIDVSCGIVLISVSYTHQMCIRDREALYAGLPVIFLVTLGGFCTNAAYCIWQNIKNKTGKEYLSVKGSVPVSYTHLISVGGYWHRMLPVLHFMSIGKLTVKRVA